MQLDVRVPIGLMFAIMGLILVVYGLATWTNGALYERSLGYNVNFWWGLFLAAFGGVMLALSRGGRQTRPADRPSQSDKPTQ